MTPKCATVSEPLRWSARALAVQHSSKVTVGALSSPVPQAAWRSFGAINTVRHISGISKNVCGAVHAADGQPEHPDSFKRASRAWKPDRVTGRGRARPTEGMNTLSIPSAVH